MNASRTLRPSVAAILAFAALAATACVETEAELREDTTPCFFVSDSTDLDTDCTAISRIVPTGTSVSEDHGVRSHFRLEDEAGEILGEEYEACLVVADEHCDLVAAEVVAAPSVAVTALLVLPLADPLENARLVDAIAHFIEARPLDERISVHRWGSEVTQVSTLSSDKDRLEGLVHSGLQPLGSEPMTLGEAVAAIDVQFEQVSTRSHQSLRQLLVVAPGYDQPVELAASAAGTTLRIEVLSQDLGPAGEAVHAVVLDESSDYEAALLDASARLWEALEVGEHVALYCGLDDQIGSSIYVRDADLSIPLVDVTVPGAQEGMRCAREEFDLDPLLPERIEIELSVLERLEYDARVADLSKEKFSGKVRTDLNVEGVSARVTLKLRGNNSLECDRKSFSLKFEDGTPRQWMDDSGTDKFFLLSMCLDDRYVTQFAANQLMAELGVLAPRNRMVELVLSGVSQGVYLLVEKPQTVLERNNTGVRMIVRRGADSEGDVPELKQSAGSEELAIARYEGFIAEAEALEGEALVAFLEESMDLDQYLRWIALMSVLESGDYVDEVYFMSTEVTGREGSASDYFTVSGWDQDDIFSPCHNAGVMAMDDAHGLLNCTEGLIDYAIFDEPLVYERYVGTLEEVMESFDESAFDDAADMSVQTLLRYFESDPTRHAMVELLRANADAVDFDVAEQEVRARGEFLKESFAARRVVLSERIEAYRLGE